MIEFLIMAFLGYKAEQTWPGAFLYVLKFLGIAALVIMVGLFILSFFA